MTSDTLLRHVKVCHNWICYPTEHFLSLLFVRKKSFLRGEKMKIGEQSEPKRATGKDNKGLSQMIRDFPFFCLNN